MSSRCNNLSSTTKANASSIAHYAISRNSSTSYDYYINTTKYTATATTDALCAKELVACGFNFNGSVTMNTKRIPYVFVFSYLTQTEVTGVMTIMEAYLDKYTMGLI
jgi:Flp pilus assembly protein TadG